MVVFQINLGVCEQTTKLILTNDSFYPQGQPRLSSRRTVIILTEDREALYRPESAQILC